jgi:drug/metabolite transporter (DMT)-like permease
MRSTALRPAWAGRRAGFAMVVCGSILWGLSGTAAQALFSAGAFTPAALVSIRMILSGALLVLWAKLGRGQQVTAIWRSGPDSVRLLVFALAGLFGVQYTYFAAIAAGNAAAATFLQYLGPVLVATWTALATRTAPGLRLSAALALAVAGTFLLATGGRWGHLAVPAPAVVWGLLSAVAMAFYTIYPAGLLQRWDSAMVTGWSMLAGGLAALALQPWHGIHLHLPDAGVALGLAAFVVVFGTLLPFWLYLASLRRVTPTETSLAACCEPLAAAVASVLALHVQLTWSLWVGGLCILLTLLLISGRRRTPPSVSGSSGSGR